MAVVFEIKSIEMYKITSVNIILKTAVGSSMDGPAVQVRGLFLEQRTYITLKMMESLGSRNSWCSDSSRKGKNPDVVVKNTSLLGHIDCFCNCGSPNFKYRRKSD